MTQVSIIEHIQQQHAVTAILCQDACNPCGVMKTAWDMACEVNHAEGTDAVNAYPPYRLMLHKLSDLAHLHTDLDEYADDYRLCKDAVEMEVRND